MRLELSHFVEGDLDDLAGWIAEESPTRALQMLREIFRAFRRIEEGPLLYQLRPDIGHEARLATVGKYVILFRVHRDVVRIERVVFGGRDLPALF